MGMLIKNNVLQNHIFSLLDTDFFMLVHFLNSTSIIQVNLQETSPKWWENGKGTTFSDWWDVPAFSTGPVGIQEDKQEGTEVDSKQNLKDEGDKRIDIGQKDNFEKGQ